MTAASIADSTHSASCLSRGLALLGLGSKPRTPLTEKNLNQHDSGSETSSTESWFTVEKPSKEPSEKLPSDSASDLRVETYEEDLPLYTEKSTLAVSVRYKYHELFFLVKPSTRVKSLKVGCPSVAPWPSRQTLTTARIRKALRLPRRAAPRAAAVRTSALSS